ncbi:uncharacterized protein LOC132702327 [Cylas formicarius]|uniref:uncharacterized protein LOC132702327 n=1 Tax=Cylas formicarius TaxID=197179 RepID=UPI00295894F7|nr:uncharacterized protein LOC132702327 [Cylas formicarius]
MVNVVRFSSWSVWSCLLLLANGVRGAEKCFACGPIADEIIQKCEKTEVCGRVANCVTVSGWRQGPLKGQNPALAGPDPIKFYFKGCAPDCESILHVARFVKDFNCSQCARDMCNSGPFVEPGPPPPAA